MAAPLGGLPREAVVRVVGHLRPLGGAGRGRVPRETREPLHRPVDHVHVQLAALAQRPRLVSCDEPVSALDLTTQRTVLDLLLEIQAETGVSYLFVSHDLSVVRCMSHRVAVLHRGEIVETGDAEHVTTSPRHPYTCTLLLSAPVTDVAEQRRRREQRMASAGQSGG